MLDGCGRLVGRVLVVLCALIRRDARCGPISQIVSVLRWPRVPWTQSCMLLVDLGFVGLSMVLNVARRSNSRKWGG